MMLTGCDEDEAYDEENYSEEEEISSGQFLSPKPSAAIDAISVGTDDKSATVMIYMNGSDLESEAEKKRMQVKSQSMEAKSQQKQSGVPE
jgi:hypothetical protein